MSKELTSNQETNNPEITFSNLVSGIQESQKILADRRAAANKLRNDQNLEAANTVYAGIISSIVKWIGAVKKSDSSHVNVQSIIDELSGCAARRRAKENIDASIASTSPLCRVVLEFENGFVRQATGAEAAKWHRYLMTIGHSPYSNVDFKDVKWETIKEKNK
jgi:hypothetical protein